MYSKKNIYSQQVDALDLTNTLPKQNFTFLQDELLHNMENQK
jgi:hypothetical protein